mmetsp:Transcript_10802/g.49798  ORF Transcript_10802/g.49798 Transcript_10802/m.49798 type:complete len:214 (-) Transcript_10802:2410-3051(-)
MFNNVQQWSRTEPPISDVHRHRVHKRNPVIVDDVHVRRQQLHVPVKVNQLLEQYPERARELHPVFLRARHQIRRQPSHLRLVHAHRGDLPFHRHRRLDRVQRLVYSPEVRRELRLVHGTLRRAHRLQRERHSIVVASRGGLKEGLDGSEYLRRDPPDDAEIDEPDLAVLAHDQVPRVHVRVEALARQHAPEPHVERVHQRGLRVASGHVPDGV